MSSIIRVGATFHGISVESRGVFTTKYGDTYAGQCKDGYACGLGVLTLSSGSKQYAEHGPDGQYDGQWLGRWANGDTVTLTCYCMHERGEQTDSADVFADGTCMYNGEFCAPDDPRLLALIAQVAPVEVRPAARAPQPPLARPPTGAIVRWIGRLVLPPAGARDGCRQRGAHPHRTLPLRAALQFRYPAGQVRFITRPKSRTMRAKRNKRSRANRTNVPK